MNHLLTHSLSADDDDDHDYYNKNNKLLILILTYFSFFKSCTAYQTVIEQSIDPYVDVYLSWSTYQSEMDVYWAWFVCQIVTQFNFNNNKWCIIFISYGHNTWFHSNSQDDRIKQSRLLPFDWILQEKPSDLIECRTYCHCHTMALRLSGIWRILRLSSLFQLAAVNFHLRNGPLNSEAAGARATVWEIADYRALITINFEFSKFFANK